MFRNIRYLRTQLELLFNLVAVGFAWFLSVEVASKDDPHKWTSFGVFLLCALLMLVAGRFASNRMFSFATACLNRKPRVAVVGNASRAVELGWRLRSKDRAQVCGVILPCGTKDTKSFFPESFPVLGSTGMLAEIINREQLDAIILLSVDVSGPELEACSEISTRMGVTMTWSLAQVPDVDRLRYSDHLGLPLLEANPVRFTRGQQIMKRTFDLLAASLLLLLLGPLMLLIAIAVKLGSSGPVLFKAPRVGLGGRYFLFLKFRSMYTGMKREDVAHANEKSGHIFKIKNDKRITPLGRVLRRYSLDELPQLINVLKGDMSLVGPRPLPIEDLGPDGMSQTFAIWSEQRASVPPGITGLWQIRGRSELPFSDLVRHDLEYVHNWSLGLDIRILAQTPLHVISAKGAY